MIGLIIVALALAGAWLAVRRTATPTPATGTGTDTEFTAEVVHITEVVPHPNADRLEIARFELKGSGPSAYDVVIGKGEFRPGDLAAYFSVDCLLPLKHPSFSFLASRLDGQGKDVFRLRAARLRSVYSQGLLVKAPESHDFGDRVDETFGVTYYRAPEPGQPAQANPRSKRASALPTYSVESLKKVPRLFKAACSEEDHTLGCTERCGMRVVVTEKIHGCNFRFGWVRRKVLGIPLGWRFFVGSHYADKALGGGGFYDSNVWCEAAVKMDLKRKTEGHKGKLFYGELYGFTYSGQAIQKGYPYGRTPETGPGLVVFDIKELSGDRYLDYVERMRILAGIGLEHSPVLRAAEYTPALLELAEGKSILDPKTQREGVVVETWGAPEGEKQRRKAKYVGQGYLLAKEPA